MPAVCVDQVVLYGRILHAVHVHAVLDAAEDDVVLNQQTLDQSVATYRSVPVEMNAGCVRRSQTGVGNRVTPQNRIVTSGISQINAVAAVSLSQSAAPVYGISLNERVADLGQIK